jgi:ketosteroid isomerase-like protein
MREESTSPDLVQLVRQAIDAADREDWDAIESLLAPDVVWESLDGLGRFAEERA